MQVDTMIQAAIQETSQHAHTLIGVQLNLVDMAHLLTVVRLAAAHPEIDATHQHFALAFIRQCVISATTPLITAMTSRIAIAAIVTSSTRRADHEQNHLQQLGPCPIRAKNQNSISA